MTAVQISCKLQQQQHQSVAADKLELKGGGGGGGPPLGSVHLSIMIFPSGEIIKLKK